MKKSIYLINPAADLCGYYTAEVFAASGLAPAVLTADLAIATLAAMVPPDFGVQLCEEYLTPVDFDTTATFIGITGKVTQWGHMRAIADEFRRRGKVVLIGGPFASLSPDVVRPHCDILVRGEIEEIAAQIFSDLREGRWQSEYQGEKPDIGLSPVPRWDLYPNDRALTGILQTSRGCPFECEFCDVIQYVGRKQRHKPVALVLRELDALYRHGYRDVFLADDNFTVHRARARELLLAIREWNGGRPHGRVRLSTQVSIDAARDEELLRLCVDAGLDTVFIGIETPNEDSLRETRKRQNLKVDLVEQVKVFVENGLMVMGGMIVGFDHDGPNIFEVQHDFAMACPVPIFTLGALVAPAATPLHARLAASGRLVSGGSEFAGSMWSTNIVPLRMSSTQLMHGLHGLGNRLYDPDAFGERLLHFVDCHGRRHGDADHAGRQPAGARPVNVDAQALLARFAGLGPREARLWQALLARAAGKPRAGHLAMQALMEYMQVRHMYAQGQHWEPLPAAEPQPRTASTSPVSIVRPLESTGRRASRPSPAPVPAQDDPLMWLLSTLNARGIRISRNGGQLQLSAPAGALDAQLRSHLAAHKQALIDRLAGMEGSPQS